MRAHRSACCVVLGGILFYAHKERRNGGWWHKASNGSSEWQGVWHGSMHWEWSSNLLWMADMSMLSLAWMCAWMSWWFRVEEGGVSGEDEWMGFVDSYVSGWLSASREEVKAIERKISKRESEKWIFFHFFGVHWRPLFMPDRSARMEVASKQGKRMRGRSRYQAHSQRKTSGKVSS